MINIYFLILTISWLMVLKGAFSKVATDRREEAWGRRSLFSVWIKIITFQKCPKKTTVSMYELKMRIVVGLFAIFISLGSIWVTYKFVIQFI